MTVAVTVPAATTAPTAVIVPVLPAGPAASDPASGASHTGVFPTSRRAAKAAPPARKAASRPVRPSRSRSPLKIAVILLTIPGLFLTAGLPAYAFSPGSGADTASTTHSLATAGAQGVTVAAAATAVTVARDGFTATTTEELAQRDAAAKKAQRVANAAKSAAAAFAVYGVRAEGDDYPWFDQATDSQGGGLSPLGYYNRECVDFVAWRLNRDAGSTSAPWRWTWSTLTPGGGNASSWSSAWSNHGWATSTTPVVGAVAWFNYNHVAYVQSIGSDGSVMLEEYNWNGSHAYHTRTVAAGGVPLFLYPPA
jgi:surface antigen